ncbi:hypothetical protein L6164_020758 [Bauhinia variegata]|uniref:Uncharacterized protein n=1 Tax=Bauhinia variegata TaxID=167791 RepID=A0ACB9MWK1_BAUVA|nr:hypothetical protein L6164_020758 [Bauhinia variegata]
MGKTPGKWIKSLLSGKKSSKSNLSKKSDIFKPSSNNDVFVSSDISVSAPIVNSSLITAPISGANPTKETFTDTVSGSSNDQVILSAGDEEANAPAVVDFSSQDDIENIKLTKAAIKAQAALRGYLARRTFRMLKGITQLQALIRAHLVRRQAVSTLYCVKGIVKFQALVRGYKVRHSEIGLAVHTICKGTKYSNSIRVVTPTQVEKLSESVFVHKLLALSSPSVPVHLNYDHGEPNLAWDWLDRWTKSHFWAPLPESNKKVDSVSEEKKDSQKVEKDEGQTKSNARRVSKTKAENGSSSDSNKNKRQPKKGSSHTLQPAHENSQKEIEKNNSKRTSMQNVSDKSEVSNEERKHSTRKVSGHTVPNVAEQDRSASAEKIKEMAGSKSKKSDLEKSLGRQAENENDNKLHDNPMANLQTSLNNGTNEGILSEDMNSGDNCVGNVNPKSSLRRASLPGKFDDQDTGVHNSPRLPSYMAPTESAKAKLRAQGSPRCVSDLLDKNGVFRRHSLSTSMNGKLDSYSPRAERLLALSSKGVIRTDRSLSSLRDGTDKIIQPLWRR